MYIVRRSTHNPIISPIADRQWEARATFNPAPVKRGNATYVLYRALGRPDALMTPAGVSTVGSALSLDGEHFQNHRQLIIPQEPWEAYGCEDPRVTFFEGKYIIFYTALGGMPFGAGNIKVGMAISSDLEHIDEKHLVTPFNAKAMALFPQRIGGKITAILTVHTDEPPAHIAIVQCDKLEELWDRAFWEKWHAELDKHIIDPRRGERDHVEVGAAPLVTPDGWLLFYSYIQNYFGGGARVFGIEALLLGKNNPLDVIGKTKGPILVPEEIYERYGMVPNIVFPSGALLEKNRVDIYYGAADTVCAKASLHLPDLLAAMLPERRVELVVRAKENPILRAVAAHPWENRAVFNPTAVDLGGTVHLLYRAMGDDHTSVLGYATSKNGVKITSRSDSPVYVPRADFEKKKKDGASSGCEDPRLTRIGNTLYLTYTAFDGVNPWRAALSSISVKDFLAQRWSKWSMPQLITPDPVQDKDACVLPGKVGGQYMLLHRIDPQICADFVDSLDFSKSRITRCIEILNPRPGSWDSQKIGIAGPPIETPKGWLLIYHGVSIHSTYRLGAALLDRKNPGVVLSRTVDAILEPLTEYEQTGQVPNAVFSCGAVVRGDTIFLYYGAADTTVAVAKLSLKKLLKILLPDTLQ